MDTSVSWALQNHADIQHCMNMDTKPCLCLLLFDEYAGLDASKQLAAARLPAPCPNP